MSVAMFLAMSGGADAPSATTWETVGTPVRLWTLVPVVPPGASAAAPLVVEAAAGEPTWEDAAWQ
jgi:hypothetical protein